MKQAKNIWLSILGFVLIGGGIYLIKTVPDPQGIMRALPFLWSGSGAVFSDTGWANCWRKKRPSPIRKWRARSRSRRRTSAT